GPGGGVRLAQAFSRCQMHRPPGAWPARWGARLVTTYLAFPLTRYILLTTRWAGRTGAMQHWTVDAPTTLDFDGVAALRVRVVSGSVAVLSTADKPRLDVACLAGQPLLVKHEAGILTITYPDLTWDGMLGWLRPQPHSATITVMVPRECPAQLGVVSAS